MDETTPAVNNRCPRCGGGFHCGVDDAAPCACAALRLDATSLQVLGERYAGCLCQACLSQIEAKSHPAAAHVIR